MPTYEYVCRSCGDGFEVTQAFTDSPLTTCAECGGPLKKVYGSIGIVFKGTGFYRTENRAKSSTLAATSNGSSAGKDAAGAPEPVSTSTKDAAPKPSGAAGSTDKTASATPTTAAKP